MGRGTEIKYPTNTQEKGKRSGRERKKERGKKRKEKGKKEEGKGETQEGKGEKGKRNLKGKVRKK